MRQFFESRQMPVGTDPTNPPPMPYERTRGNRQYELSNHLGNVLTAISDKKTGVAAPNTTVAAIYKANVTMASDYYPFGLQMPGRMFNEPNYRYGFNGKENSEGSEWGTQLVQDYGFRLYNPGIGRFLSVDPLARSFPELTPYQFASNTPIQAVDLDGLESLSVHSAFWTEWLWGYINANRLGEVKPERLIEEVHRINAKGYEGSDKGNYDNQRYAIEHYESEGDVVTIEDETGPLRITGYTNANKGTVYKVDLYVEFIKEDSKFQSKEDRSAILQMLIDGHNRLNDRMPHNPEYSSTTFEGSKPVIFGTISVVGGILTLGRATGLEAGSATLYFAVFNGGGSVVFGIDGITTDADGETFVEKEIFTGKNGQTLYNGFKTFHSVSDARSGINSLRNKEFEAIMGLLNTLNSIPDNVQKTIQDGK